jgi:hypothetical protein
MNSIEGEVQLLVKSPLSTEEVFINEIMDDEILIYLDEDPVPYRIKRIYFENLFVEDLVYDSENTYYDLSKLFLNGGLSIILSDIDSMEDPHCRIFRLVSKKEIRIVESHIHKRILEYVEDEEYSVMEPPYICKKWQALAIFCDGGYSNINRYLIRLTDYHSGIGLFELSVQLFKWVFGMKDQPRPIRKYSHDITIQSMVDDMDHLFYKYSKKSNEPKVVYRGMNKFYTYLKKPGDKMVIENYMSCFDDGGGLPGPANIWCTITIEPGIPYLETYTDKEFRYFVLFPEEMEIILPRNLVATYIEDFGYDNCMSYKHISVSLLPISGERELYSIEKLNQN